MHNRFLPLTIEEVLERGWDRVDVVLVTGDAYVDHPSFAAAVIGRVLEAEGLRVAILSQPRWKGPEDFRRFGKPRLFFGVSAGNMDSMVNKYTALRKVRSDDAYSEGGLPFKRPDRAAIVYSQRAREAYRDVPIILGGIEASLRRFAHYDYWSEKVRRSILLDAKSDLLVYGMGEKQIVEIARRLAAGEPVGRIRDVRGTAFCMGEGEPSGVDGAVEIPSYEETAADAESFNRAVKIIHREINPLNARPLSQMHGKRRVVQLPPPMPLVSSELDAVYALPYTRKPHPSYSRPIPAYEMVKDSVTVMRGCFGGCTFCSIAIHQGKIVQCRSEGSVLAELASIAGGEGFGGTITDLGGPTANMYGMGCKESAILARCTRSSCLYPTICPQLGTAHGPLLSLMRKARQVPGVRHIFVGSGIRMDLALLEPEYIREIARHHTSGYLKVAPEHTVDRVLRVMRKPGRAVFERFMDLFRRFSREAGKEQYLVPYLISAHPGSGVEDELELALYLKERGFRPRQIQDFLPSPMDVATAVYYTGRHPFTGEEVPVARRESVKRLHRAIIQYFKIESRPLIFRAMNSHTPAGAALAARKDEVMELFGVRTRGPVPEQSRPPAPGKGRKGNKRGVGGPRRKVRR
jgi:uncharacterized radical SAM protein YgiQ